jgi:LSD1 subclass zinc finger protein
MYDLSQSFFMKSFLPVAWITGMSLFVSCTGCFKQLKLPDNAAGRKVRCPMCQTTFLAQGPAPVVEELEVLESIEPPPVAKRSSAGRSSVPPPSPGRAKATSVQDALKKAAPRRSEREEEPPEEDMASSQESSTPGGNRAAWRKVHSGLGLILVSIILSIVGSLLLVGMTFLMRMISFSNAQVPGNPMPMGMGRDSSPSMAAGFGMIGAAALVPLFVVGLVLTIMILFLVGHAFCMLVPAAKGNGGFARGLSIAAFCSFSSLFGSFVGIILHYFFLWSVCHALKKPSLAGTVSNFMYAHVILVIGTFVGLLLSILLGVLNLTVLAGFGIMGVLFLNGLGSLGLFIWYLVLLVQIRSAVEPNT